MMGAGAVARIEPSVAHPSGTNRLAPGTVPARNTIPGTSSNRSKFRIEELHLVAGINERPPQRKQTQRREMFMRNAAAYGGVRRVQQHDLHKDLHRVGRLRLPPPPAGPRRERER